MDTTVIEQLVAQPELVEDWLASASDRELAEFNAVNIIGVTRILKGIHDGLAPTLEKLAPFMAGMGL